MQISKVHIMIGIALGALALLGYCADAIHYYEPSGSADTEYAEIRSHAAAEHASIRSWSELESIKHQTEVLELKIQRILDRAAAQGRALTVEEAHEITSLREEIRLHNDRRNMILAGQKEE